MNNIESATSSPLQQLWASGLARQDQPLRLHLGCGETLLQGYVNIDYPPSAHNVMTVKPDVYADIMELDFPVGSVDEIRLHHVFEHFSRVSALAMLVKWHQWLKVGGRLHIVTPDLEGSARNIVSHQDFSIKMGSVRHLAGDQAASWAYHVDHWFAERFQRTLGHLGFDPVQTSTSSWDQPPFLWNVEAIATKKHSFSIDELLKRCDELLWQSTVSPNERPTYEVWRRQLREVLSGEAGPRATNVTPMKPLPDAARKSTNTTILELDATDPQLVAVPKYIAEMGSRVWEVIEPKSLNINVAEVTDFNQRERDRWVARKAASLPSGTTVLDVGAGTCPYRDLFAHCTYKTHDFKQYEGEKLGGTAEYGQIDYVSDVKSIPVPDNSFDVILCTEVLEHVPEPIEALREMARIVKPGGRVFISAPLGSGLHQLPYHFYGGYTPYWYEHFCAQFGLGVAEILPNGGFFKQLSQELARASGYIVDTLKLEGEDAKAIHAVFGKILPVRFFELDAQKSIEQFTVGYFVEARKPLPGEVNVDTRWSGIERRLRINPTDGSALIDAIVCLIEQERWAEATKYAERAYALDPNSEVLQKLLGELSKR